MHLILTYPVPSILCENLNPRTSRIDLFSVIIGAIAGQLSPVFEKLSKLHAKNSFSLAIVAGDLFANPEIASPENDETVSSLLAGRFMIPLPTYFTIGNHALPQKVIDRLEEATGEVCPNLYFLGKRSITKTSEGIRIVNLGGLLDPSVTAGLSKEKYLPFHTEGDAKSLHGANTADILLTSTWPSSIRTGSSIPLPEEYEDATSEQCVAGLCTALKPRYHFSTSPNFFYEREPFFHPLTEDHPDTRPITRFISLASTSSSSKAKYLYAFSLNPSASPPSELPAGSTASPFRPVTKKRPYVPEQHTHSPYSSSTLQHRPSKRARQPPPTPSECFFCLSNPSLATHLIISIATDTYLTTAKGPLSTPSTYPSLPFPAHILLIPLTHAPTLAAIPDAATYDEMQRYRSALHTMLVTKSGGELGAVTWEVSRASGIHIHWQFLPVSIGLITKGLVEAAFKVEAENEKYPLFKVRQIGNGRGEKGDYFRVWIWRPGGETRAHQPEDEEGHGSDKLDTSAGTEISLVLPLSANFRFDLQFGRRVMAKLLGLEKRANWRDCGQIEAEEVADAEAFKKAFREFDFSMED
ncbi:hypothetical protein MMC26_001035 [Xylographa opegraphella]|nr:hypothetical protein [Xylographa opegraphella]